MNQKPKDNHGILTVPNPTNRPLSHDQSQVKLAATSSGGAPRLALSSSRVVLQRKFTFLRAWRLRQMLLYHDSRSSITHRRHPAHCPKQSQLRTCTLGLRIFVVVIVRRLPDACRASSQFGCFAGLLLGCSRESQAAQRRSCMLY